MDTSRIKKYAPQARKDFIKAVSQQAAKFGITEKSISPAEVKGDIALINGKTFPSSIIKSRTALESLIKDMGYNQVMEQIAYNWFNRLIAIRYMEIHGYLQHGRRVLSHPEQEGVFQILEECTEIDLPGLDKKKIIELKLDGNKDEELYRELILAQCHALHETMPNLFEKLDDASELLLPDNLIKTDSLIRTLVRAIPENDWQDVEVVGWIYQFYISEKKDDVFAGLKKNKKITPENIPAATQLFTPHWIVRYLVENSLGRLWMLNRPESKLIEQMEYYIKPEQVESDFLKINKPEEIKICDPACGSGHMLVYAFELLYAMYKEEGHEPSSIPEKILKNNLFGIEIDERAGVLAMFALMMKAVSYLTGAKQLQFFQYSVQPNICVLHKIKFDEQELDEYIEFIGKDHFSSKLRNTLKQFEEADNFGSLIRPDITDIDEIKKILANRDLSEQLFLNETHIKVLQVIYQIELLTPKYHVVIANPPYMGSKGMNARLGAWAKENYPNSKSDLYTMFIERNLGLAKKYGTIAMITMQSWMFLSSFEKLREWLLEQSTLLSMCHLGARAFDSIGGEVVSTTAFVLENAKLLDYKGGYLRLVAGNSEAEKNNAIRETVKNSDCSWYYYSSAVDFKKIPGSPIAYWAPAGAIRAFESFDTLKDFAVPSQGMATTNNDLFLRQWHECSRESFVYPQQIDDATRKFGKWFACNKGGPFRKWYGNNNFIVNYENEGKSICDYIDNTPNVRVKSNGRVINRDKYFEVGTTWSTISSSGFSMRYTPPGYVFETKGAMCFPGSVTSAYFLTALGCSKVIDYLLTFISPTLDYHEGPLGRLPIAPIDKNRIVSLATNSINLAIHDWDSYETSWDFISLPLLNSDNKQSTLKASYQNLREHCREITLEMQRLENENNRIFIDAYGLQDELTPEVPLKEITLTCNPYYRYGTDKTDEELKELFLTDTIKEMLSYSVGCMMGRYSLDEEGLVYANSSNEGFDSSKYKTYPADDDGIIPLTDMEWFPDDATHRFQEFISVTFDKGSLKENLRFIADALKPKRGEDALDTIRRYFSDYFFKDHIKTYKKRPIYWLFSSGKEKAFEGLVYLHRYNEGTLARMRTEYVIPLSAKLKSYEEKLQTDMNATDSAAEKNKLEKEISGLHKKQTELNQFDEKLKHFADQRIKLDLDDGVKVNYGKFGDLLSEVKAITGNAPE